MQDNTPVYKHDNNKLFLFRRHNGNWMVGTVAGNTMGFLMQPSNNSTSPHKTIPWQYAADNAWHDKDETLRVYPCY